MQTSHASIRVLMNNRGFSIPYIPIIIAVVGALTYFFGWKVLIVAGVIIAVIPIATYIYDKITHSKNCRYCNEVKRIFSEHRKIDIARVTTKH